VSIECLSCATGNKEGNPRWTLGKEATEMPRAKFFDQDRQNLGFVGLRGTWSSFVPRKIF